MQIITDSNVPKFIGLDTQYVNADGQKQTRVHLDGAASPLAAQTAVTMINKLLPHYSNTHSVVHNSAQISTQALAWAHQVTLNFVGANSDQFAVIFTGAGTTSGINRVARGLSLARPDRKIVLVSAMEHHANDLPHRQFENDVIYIPLTGDGVQLGAIDTQALEKLCQQKQSDINYIAVSSVSNVTGIRNPIKEITEIAHRYGILVLVDAAQSMAHSPTLMDENNADFLVFSGHKVYTPMAPGVLVARKSILKDLLGQDLGGGSVASVSYYDFEFVEDSSEKEESGTPNIVGAIALAAVLDELQSLGMSSIEAKDNELLQYLKQQLESINDIQVYGGTRLARTGALAFNHRHIDHGLLAAILNDYFTIAVRNECFCAHPYVSSLLKEELWQLDLGGISEEQQESFINRKRGMVRASLSLYNTVADVDALIAAIKQISSGILDYSVNYNVQTDGSYHHMTFSVDWKSHLGL
jgi:selenocysteine lyase/cysteine desulfurase